MTGPTLPNINTLPSLPPSDCFQILDTLFEPSQALHALAEALLLQKTYTSYQALIDLVRGRLTALASSQTAEDRAILLNILGSHPRLGEKAAPSNAVTGEDAQEQDQQPLSELSRAEQENLNKGSAEQLRELNQEYEEKFPGLRFVTFVNGREKDEIMREMRLRIDRGDLYLEMLETIQAMCDIATDRVRKLESGREQ